MMVLETTNRNFKDWLSKKLDRQGAGFFLVPDYTSGMSGTRKKPATMDIWLFTTPFTCDIALRP